MRGHVYDVQPPPGTFDALPHRLPYLGRSFIIGLFKFLKVFFGEEIDVRCKNGGSVCVCWDRPRSELDLKVIPHAYTPIILKYVKYVKYYF